MMAIRVSSLPGIRHPGAVPHAPPPRGISSHPTASCFTGEETEAQGVHGADPGSHSQQVEEAHGIQTEGSLSQTHSKSGSLLPSLFGACREPGAVAGRGLQDRGRPGGCGEGRAAASPQVPRDLKLPGLCRPHPLQSGASSKPVGEGRRTPPSLRLAPHICRAAHVSSEAAVPSLRPWDQPHADGFSLPHYLPSQGPGSGQSLPAHCGPQISTRLQVQPLLEAFISITPPPGNQLEIQLLNPPKSRGS